MIATKKWSKEEISKRLATDDAFMCRALLQLYDRQTMIEQDAKQTGVVNNIGFNKPDAYSLSYHAAFIQKRRKCGARFIPSIRKRILKYAGQITKIANGEC